MNVTIRNKKFPAVDFVPGETHDCLQLCRERHYVFEDCVIDASLLDNEVMDEAIGITWGASATFRRCLIADAGKLVLIGSGDKAYRSKEEKAVVIFEDCWLENFCRRGPEVQCGTKVTMDGCLISDWGSTEHWDTRAFGAWVHDGGQLFLRSCMFRQTNRPSLIYRLRDHIAHIGQAVNDNGLGVLFRKRTYVSGWRRGCTVDKGGYLEASYCWHDDNVIIDNLSSKMPFSVAQDRIDQIESYFEWLETSRAITSIF